MVGHWGSLFLRSSSRSPQCCLSTRSAFDCCRAQWRTEQDSRVSTDNNNSTAWVPGVTWSAAACPGCDGGNELTCAPVLNTETVLLLCVRLLALLSSHPKRRSYTVDGGSLKTASLRGKTMGDSLELIGKRLLLLLDDGKSANGSEPEQSARSQDWLRGTVRAVSVMGLAAPEVSGGEATTSTTTAAGLTVSVYIQVVLHCIAKHQNISRYI